VLITPQALEIHRVVVSKTYVPGELDFRGAEFRQEEPLNVGAVAELEGGEIRIRGHIKTALATSCDRCLGQVEVQIDRDFDLFYRPLSTIAREEEIEVPDDEMEVGFYSGDGVELDDVITEQVILALPMKVVCGPDCRGLCPSCGANRNSERCDCSSTQADSPFAALR
jgi:DUF177 domain-containing protein